MVIKHTTPNKRIPCIIRIRIFEAILGEKSAHYTRVNTVDEKVFTPCARILNIWWKNVQSFPGAKNVLAKAWLGLCSKDVKYSLGMWNPGTCAHNDTAGHGVTLVLFVVNSFKLHLTTFKTINIWFPLLSTWFTLTCKLSYFKMELCTQIFSHFVNSEFNESRYCFRPNLSCRINVKSRKKITIRRWLSSVWGIMMHAVRMRYW